MASETSEDELGIAQRLLLLLFVGGILEPLGMLMYLMWSSPTALERLMEGGISPGEVLPFLLDSPDRLAVAVAIALLALLFAWKADPGGSTHHHNPGGGF
jgi:uncharacterized BrkB/YihY/UPF0761 family membrane protein